nr:hypothetical protein [Tanacetum cinerariifolium]
MVGPSEGGGPEVQDDREATPPPLTKEKIEGHLSALRSIIKEHNRKNKTDPIQLDFDEEDTAAKDTHIVKGKEVVDNDLRKPFKEALKTSLTRRIIEFASPEYNMPTNIKLHDGTTNPEDHLGRFASAANSGECPMLRVGCFNKLWTDHLGDETGFIMGVPKVKKISSFMDLLKCLELAKCFSDKAPTTVNEMMKRLDDFVRSERAFAQTELPKGETGEQHQKSYFPSTQRDDRPLRNNNHVTDQRRPMIHPQRGGNMDRFCDYHQEKGKKESKGEWSPTGQGNQHVENQILEGEEKEGTRSDRKVDEHPITFSLVSTEGVLDETLIVEAEVEGYLVRRIYVDGGASVEVMFEHCFENLSPAIKAKLKETQTDLVCFVREATKPLGKIELEAVGKETSGRRRKEGRGQNKDDQCNGGGASELDIFRSIGRYRSRTTQEVQSSAEALIENKMDIFSWEPADMIGAPRRIIEHNLNGRYCSTGQVPHLDFQPGRVRNGFQIQVFLGCIQGLSPNSDVEEDDEKTAFYSDQGTYCYTKMPFGLKNAGAIVEEGKFLGYMVTFEGIRANPKKTKVLADLHSPRTLKEMQSLAGKLAALNGLSADEEMHHKLSVPHPFIPKRNFIRIPVSKEAVCVVLLTDQKGKQSPIHYVSRALNEVERNYAPMEKLALSLVHMTRRLRRYFEAHPVNIITDQPIKQILSKTEASRKLAKYDVELGAYNITFEPRNAMKGQVLADFITKTPDEELPKKYFWTPKMVPERDDTKEWTLFTDRASSLKGSEAGLLLIGPSGVEHTYALRLTFDNTNNEAEYEALLAGLRITRLLNIQKLEARVDSKLVASLITGTT